MSFRKDFVWGAATASYQVEGAAYEDGKGLNIWDVFCKEDGHVYEHHTGDVACDQCLNRLKLTDSLWHRRSYYYTVASSCIFHTTHAICFIFFCLFLSKESSDWFCRIFECRIILIYFYL